LIIEEECPRIPRRGWAAMIRFRIVEEPPNLRHFTARLEEIK